MTRILKYALLVMALAAGGFLYWFPRVIGTEGWALKAAYRDNITVTDHALGRQLASYSTGLSGAAYEETFRYLLEGYSAYRSAAGAFAFYPGAHSSNGRTVDGLEGFARFFPIAGAWLSSGRSDRVNLGDREVVLSAMLKEGLLSGTRREGPEYWGHINSYSQRLVEASDVALGLWLSRRQVWEKLDASERKQVVRWLSKALDVNTWPGTWQLFPVTVHTVLTALGENTCCYDQIIGSLYTQFKANYKGGGWFDDPPNGFDYYNAWAIHYSLFWLDQIDPQLDPRFIRQVHSEFVGFYKYLMSPRGVPMMGRSICYRLATPAPLLTALVLAPDKIDSGVAMRALDSVWGYFVGKGALANGAITQGYCGKDLSILDNYSGPASCLWGARSLLLAFYLDPKLRLFETKREPLPVERADYVVENSSLAWTVTGKMDSGEVILTLNGNSPDQDSPLQRYGIKHQVHEMLAHSPRRPNNHEALYQRRDYSSHKPIIGCLPG